MTYTGSSSPWTLSAGSHALSLEEHFEPWTLTSTIVLGLALWTFVRNATRYSKSGLPGPPTIPILGSLPWLGNGCPKISLGRLADKYGAIFEMHFGMRPMVIISDARLADQILVEQSGKVGGERSWMSYTKELDLDRIFPSACANDNPIIEPCRRLNMRVLRMVGNETTAEACKETVRSYTEKIEQNNKNAFNAEEIGMAFSMVLLGDAAFGLQGTCEEMINIPEFNQVFNASRDVLAAVTLSSEFSFTFPVLCLFKPWEALHSKTKARTIRRNFLTACENLETKMLAKVQSSNKGWDQWRDCTFKQTYGQGSQDGKKISLEDENSNGFLHPLLQSVITLVAGAHSVSVLVTIELACLAYDPDDQQEKLLQDILLSDHNSDPKKKLESYPPRALAIVRESLRSFSPAPVALPLQVSEDVTIPTSNVRLHKGTIILPLSEHINKAQSQSWDPDTMLAKMTSPETSGERGHVSFGFGRRRCPAADFSEKAIAAFIVDFVRAFRVTFEQPDKFAKESGTSMIQMLNFQYSGFNQAPKPPKIVISKR
ncbi:unnamed protein product [Sympodiomycopsis kandeliae]